MFIFDQTQKELTDSRERISQQEEKVQELKEQLSASQHKCSLLETDIKHKVRKWLYPVSL